MRDGLARGISEAVLVWLVGGTGLSGPLPGGGYLDTSGHLPWGSGGHTGGGAVRQLAAFDAAGVAELLTESSYLRDVRALKAADTTVNNSTTFIDDPHLVVPVEAGRSYQLQALIITSSGATPDFKMRFGLPSDATVKYGHHGTAQAVYTGTRTLAGYGTDTISTFTGVITVGGTGGNAVVQWAQAVADASDTILRAGSFLRMFLA